MSLVNGKHEKHLKRGIARLSECDDRQNTRFTEPLCRGRLSRGIVYGFVLGESRGKCRRRTTAAGGGLFDVRAGHGKITARRKENTS